MRGTARVFVVPVLLLALCAPAMAWNVETQRAIITSASRMMSRDGTVPLARLQRDLLAGASLSPAALQALIPKTEDAMLAIHGEVQLLQVVRGDAVDPYYVYRLGALARLVAQVSAPMATAKPLYRSQFDEDVAQRISRVALTPVQGTIVEPLTYLREVQTVAAERDAVIQKDYQTGVGFKGIASSRYEAQVNDSIEAVINIWHTVLMGRVVVADASEAKQTKYILNALAYYIGRKNSGEINAAYERLMAGRSKNTDLMKSIGDMFYEAGMRERAVREYQAILAIQPSRTDIVRRIADYYVDRGDEELERLRLELARDHFTQALTIDKLHPTAEVKRLGAEKLIAERNARELAAQEAVKAGKDFEESAEEKALRKDYSGAIQDLKHAGEVYRSVGNEFPVQSRRAQLGINNARSRIIEMRDELIRGASSLGGGLSGGLAREKAAERAAAQGERALRDLITDEYNTQIEKIDRGLAEQLRSN